ncbi:MAG: efflux RND transporter periplasmic adaptor subunit [Isosphaeraceae bacterium]
MLLIVGLTAANVGRRSGLVNIDWQVVKAPAVEVHVESPSLGAISRKITAPGTVEPLEEAKIGSQILGRVVAVNVKEGDAVKADTVLVKLDDTDSRARLATSQARCERIRAAIAQAESDLEKANRDSTLQDRLAGRGFATRTDVADARTILSKAEAARQIALREHAENEAMMELSREELKRTEIVSPINGIVTSLDVRVGEVVIAGTINVPGTTMMTVSDLDHMRVSADVDESDVPLISPGQSARVYLQCDEKTPIAGTVERVASKGKKSGDAVKFETRIVVERPPPLLRAGMTATVELEVQRADNAIGIPVQAVMHRKRTDLPDSPELRAWAENNAGAPGERGREAQSRYVTMVLVEEQGLARARLVQIGISDERRVQIVSGLTQESRVIVGPFRALDELKDGQAVRSRFVEGGIP